MATRTVSVDLIQHPIWFLRLAQDSKVQDRFAQDPMIFSTWYAVMHSIFPWPEEVRNLQEIERKRKLSFERMSSLLAKVNYTATSQMNAEYARRVLEGYAVHDWYRENQGAFSLYIPHTLSFLLEMQTDLSTLTADGSPSAESSKNMVAITRRIGDARPFGGRLAELSLLARLTPLEEQIFAFAVTCSISPETHSLVDQLLRQRKSEAAALLALMFGCSEEELLSALAPASALRTSRLLSAHSTGMRLPHVSEFWIQLLIEPGEPLLQRLAEPMPATHGSGIPARLIEEDLELAAQVLKNGQEPGVNLLLYGVGSLERRAVLRELATRAGKQAWQLRTQENAWAELPTIAMFAQRALHARYGHEAVLVIERPLEVLERKPSDLLRRLFGLELDNQPIAPFDAMMLESNPAPTIWTGAGADSLPEDTTTRFIFHAPLQKTNKEERRAQLEQQIREMKLTKKATEELLKFEDISALQLATATRAAKLSGATSRKDRETALVQAVRRSLKALSRDAQPKAKESVTEYSLKYLNTTGRFGPEQVLKALKNRPKGSMCLYGPPGTGKTQFVEYMAQTLGKRLLVKRASDLLSKWVGESEQNIAAMFTEAADQDAILFLDEGDSFLRDRNLAQAGWEVTKVNELLQHMERFEGIFIVATNLFRGLDMAALRRFTFKIEFCALSAEQRWEMFVNEAGLKGKLSEYPRSKRDDWLEQLCFMQQLAAGDFATVKRQCVLMDETLTPEQWLEQLHLECAVKSQAAEGSGVRM